MACQSCFVSSASCAALVETHRQLFSQCGPKEHVFGCGSDADFTQRMDASGGTLMWMTDETVTCLDCDFLSGASRSKDASKVDMQSILSCQNGGSFGPKSIKSQRLSSVSMASRIDDQPHVLISCDVSPISRPRSAAHMPSSWQARSVQVSCPKQSVYTKRFVQILPRDPIKRSSPEILAGSSYQEILPLHVAQVSCKDLPANIS